MSRAQVSSPLTPAGSACTAQNLRSSQDAYTVARPLWHEVGKCGGFAVALDISEQEIRQAQQSIAEGLSRKYRLRHNYIGTEHLFNAMTRLPGSRQRLLVESGMEPHHSQPDPAIGGTRGERPPPLTPRAQSAGASIWLTTQASA